MKIVDIQPIICNARMRNWVFVKVITDQNGLWGWGEATLEWHTKGVVGAIEDIKTLLIGEDPRRIEWRCRSCHHRHHLSHRHRPCRLSRYPFELRY